jgi:carbonic anhydrase
MKVIKAETSRHYQQACALFEEYGNWLGIDLSFQNFDAELQTPEHIYGPPYGCLFIALEKREAAGCVGIRALPIVGNEACEMKRLYVRPAYRGSGLGRRLAEAAVHEARRLGYKRMFLDTLERMEHARAVYGKLGFRQVEPYYYNPVNGIVFMELNLGSTAD